MNITEKETVNVNYHQITEYNRVKYENNILYMKTIGYYKNRNPLSFTQAGKVDMYATYKFCLKKGKVKLASKYATVKDMSNIRIAMNSFTTSSTCNLKDKKVLK